MVLGSLINENNEKTYMPLIKESDLKPDLIYGLRKKILAATIHSQKVARFFPHSNYWFVRLGLVTLCELNVGLTVKSRDMCAFFSQYIQGYMKCNNVFREKLIIKKKIIFFTLSRGKNCSSTCFDEITDTGVMSYFHKLTPKS